MEVKNVPIRDVKPYEKNPRKNAKAVPEVVKSLQEFGWRQPLVVDTNMVLVVGHTRLLAAKQLKMKEVPVHIATDLTPAQAKAYRIMDNRTSDHSEWEYGTLLSELDELFQDNNNYNLDFFDFDTKDFDEAIGFDNPISNEDSEDKFFDESKQDEIPSVENTDARVTIGDIWQLGDHRLICGDSTDKESVLSLFSDNKAALLFTSPPYSNQRTYKGDKELSTEYISTFISVASDLCELLAVNLGLSRKDGEIIQYWDDYIKKAKDAGLKLLSWNVWDKGEAGSIGNQMAMFAITHEWIFVFGKNRKELNKTYPNKSQGILANHNGNRQTDGTIKKSKDVIISDFSQIRTVYSVTPQKARDGIDHPARFPVEFPQGYIEACTNPRDWVYEPFCGSGTTLIACEKTDRKCLAMELDPQYCDIILKRWETVTGKEAVKISNHKTE